MELIFQREASSRGWQGKTSTRWDVFMSRISRDDSRQQSMDKVINGFIMSLWRELRLVWHLLLGHAIVVASWHYIGSYNQQLMFSLMPTTDAHNDGTTTIWYISFCSVCDTVWYQMFLIPKHSMFYVCTINWYQNLLPVSGIIFVSICHWHYTSYDDSIGHDSRESVSHAQTTKHLQ